MDPDRRRENAAVPLIKKDTKVELFDGYDAGIAKPTEHPRLYFTKSDIPLILANKDKEQMVYGWAAQEKNLKEALDGGAPAGAYYTNEEATLDYIDMNGNGTTDAEDSIGIIRFLMSTLSALSISLPL